MIVIQQVFYCNQKLSRNFDIYSGVLSAMSLYHALTIMRNTRNNLNNQTFTFIQIFSSLSTYSRSPLQLLHSALLTLSSLPPPPQSKKIIKGRCWTESFQVVRKQQTERAMCREFCKTISFVDPLSIFFTVYCMIIQRRC